MNDKPYQHRSRNGTEFICDRCDLRGTIFYKNEYGYGTISRLMTDVAEMAAMHSLFIRPELNGFSGYDTLRFEELP